MPDGLLLMVILEMLSRAYSGEHEAEEGYLAGPVDSAAVRNYCLHRSGPVATGELGGDILTCPWHGYQYDLTTGEFIHDRAVKLDTYPREVRNGMVYVQIPTVVMGSESE